jgi:hypothetical protein
MATTAGTRLALVRRVEARSDDTLVAEVDTEDDLPHRRMARWRCDLAHDHDRAPTQRYATDGICLRRRDPAARPTGTRTTGWAAPGRS